MRAVTAITLYVPCVRCVIGWRGRGNRVTLSAAPSPVDEQPRWKDGDLFMSWLRAGLELIGVIVALTLRFDSWDAHGFGAAGGEGNSVFFPWFHTALWVASCLSAGRLRSRAIRPASPR